MRRVGMLGKVLVVLLLAVLIGMDPNGCMESVGHVGAAAGHLGGAVSSIGKAIVTFGGTVVTVAGELASRTAISLKLTPPPPGRYVDQVFVITGASSGIGESVAYEAAAQGATLVLAARRLDRLSKVAARCTELGAKDVLVHEYDAKSPTAGPALVDAALKKFSRIDTLVLNAGIGGPWSTVENLQDLAPVRELMDVNYWGYVTTAKSAISALKESSGRIVVVSSQYGLFIAPYQAGYCATKFALNAFFKTLRQELLPYGVSVTIHSPGGVETEVTSKLRDSQNREATLTIPNLFKGDSTECAKSILRASDSRTFSAFYPFYVGPISFIDSIWPELFETGYHALVRFYFEMGFFNLKPNEK